MSIRRRPTEEYRKKLRERHVLEWICLVMAAMIIAGVMLFFLNHTTGMWILRTVVLLGVLMNLGLSIRCVLMKEWIRSAGLLLVSAALAAALIYLIVT